MKTKNLFLLPALIAVLNLIPAGPATAQTFTTLHSFTFSDGTQPNGGLITNLSGNTLYGTTAGTVFAINTNGTGFTNLHSFAAWSRSSSGEYTNSDGARPLARLTLSGNTLFGTALQGGSWGRGTVFAVNTDGSDFTNLHSFTSIYLTNTNSDGTFPSSGLVLSGNKLYGTGLQGGSSGAGTVFAINTNGTGFTNLHSFRAGDLDSSGVYTNSDGDNLQAGLILSGNTLYGTAQYGGSSGKGTMFALHTDGTDFTTLHNFTATSCFGCPNNDGANPWAGLVLSGNTLYGTAYFGGSGGNGTVFGLSFQPQLTIARSAATVILSWPANVAGFDYTGYTLQSAPALTGTFTNLPAATSPYTNPITGPQQFYRLISN